MNTRLPFGGGILTFVDTDSDVRDVAHNPIYTIGLKWRQLQNFVLPSIKECVRRCCGAPANAKRGQIG